MYHGLAACAGDNLLRAHERFVKPAIVEEVSRYVVKSEVPGLVGRFFAVHAESRGLDSVTHSAMRPGARLFVPRVMAEGDFRLMTPLYVNLQ